VVFPTPVYMIIFIIIINYSIKLGFKLFRNKKKQMY